MLEVQSVSKNFGALQVLDGLSLQVQDGEALGIIGPNGAGKSTLFNLIAGEFGASRGKIIYQGKDLGSLSAQNRCHLGIGRSYQIPRPFAKMTVFENLLVANSFGSGSRDRANTDQCVQILEKTDLLKYANNLSSSLTLLQRKKLELARALATNPKLLLLDEIAGGLTEGECHSLIQVIESIRKDGISIIWIEHIFHALSAVVDKVLAINFGQFLAYGTPKEVIESAQVQEVYMGIEVE